MRDPYLRNLVLSVINSRGADYAHSYDALSRPVARNGETFAYNDRSEVVSSRRGAENAETYSYDEIGNLLYASSSFATNTYAANNLNQYSSISTLRASAPPRETTPTYDADGNLVQDDRFAYAYDAENRMLSARPIAPSEGDFAVVNAYDHKHRRVMKRVERFDGDEWQASETHTFTYDGSNIVLERIAFSDGSTRTVEYFWGNDFSGTEQGAGGVGGLLAVSIDGVFFIPCYDHNGNIVCYVSESGSIAALYVYDPYGNVIDQYGALADRFAIRFSTKYTDVETGLISYLRRFYRPDHGRWLNRDPIEEEGGENLYVMCNNNPVVSYDKLGLIDMSDCATQLQQIYKKAYKLAETIAKYDPMSDSVGGFQFFGGVTKPGGHYQKIKNLQHGLKNDLKTFVENCLKGRNPPEGGSGIPVSFPRWVDELANREIPMPISFGVSNWEYMPCLPYDERIEIKVDEKVSQDAQLRDASVVVVKVAATAGGCYIAYRIVRLLPSLFPPAWPSIPLNLATP